MSLHTARRLNPLATVAAAPAAPAERGAAWSQRLQLLLESTGEGIFGIDLNELGQPHLLPRRHRGDAHRQAAGAVSCPNKCGGSSTTTGACLPT